MILLFFFSRLPPPPISTLFPYTTLFRSPARSTSFPLRSPRMSLNPVALRPGCGRLSTSPMAMGSPTLRSEEHTSELQSLRHLVCRLLLEKKKRNTTESHVINNSQHQPL